jgi:predicted PurR-regulated permease PerM
MAETDVVMFSKRQIAFIMSLVYLLLTLAVLAFIYYVVPSMLIWLLPFIVAYFFSAIAKPLSALFIKYFKFPKKAARAVSIILVFIIFGGLIGILVFKIISELSLIVSQTPKYVEMTKNIIDNLPLLIKDIYKNLPAASIQYIDKLLGSVSADVQGIQQFASKALTGIGTFITNIPSTIIFIFFTLISSFFLTIDDELIKDTLKKIIPKRVYNGIAEAKKNSNAAIWG